MALTVAMDQMLRRESDLTYRIGTLTEIEETFARGGQLADLVTYAKAVVQRVLEERATFARPADTTATRTHPDFESLFRAALRRRVGGALAFFQYRNPIGAREAAPPFLLAPDFSRRLLDAIDREIVPVMMKSRQMRMIESERDWTPVAEKDFWDLLEDRQSGVVLLWRQGWDALRPTRKKTADGVKYAVGPALKRLREELASDDYTMPRIDDRMISLFASLIDPDQFGAGQLEEAWACLRQIYQREFGAGGDRDATEALLTCFVPVDDSPAEFLALLFYWNFPRIDRRFLTAVAATRGKTREDRLERIPYLMWFLDQDPGASEGRRSA